MRKVLCKCVNINQITWTADKVLRRWGSWFCTGRNPPDSKSWQSTRNWIIPSLGKWEDISHKVNSEDYALTYSYQRVYPWDPYRQHPSTCHSFSGTLTLHTQSRQDPGHTWKGRRGCQIGRDNAWDVLLCYEACMLVHYQRGWCVCRHNCILHNNSHSCLKLWNANDSV